MCLKVLQPFQKKISRLQSRGQMYVRRLDHAVKRNLRKNALEYAIMSSLRR